METRVHDVHRQRNEKMKKLVVLAAIAAMAVALQGATFQWQTSTAMKIFDVAGVTDNGTYAAGDSNLKKSDGSLSVFLAIYDGTTLVGTATGNYNQSTTGNKANVSNLGVADAAVSTTYRYELTLSGSYTPLSAKASDDFDYSAAIISTTLTGEVETMSSTMAMSKIATEVPTTWTISGITAKTTPPPGPDPDTDTPEPTSGVLMLVGAGVLALRRKQR